MEFLEYLLGNGLIEERLNEENFYILPNKGLNGMSVSEFKEYDCSKEYIALDIEGYWYSTNDIKGYLSNGVDTLIGLMLEEWENEEGIQTVFNGVGNFGVDYFENFGQLMGVTEWTREEVAMLLMSDVDKGWLVWDSSEAFRVSTDLKGMVLSVIDWWYSNER